MSENVTEEKRETLKRISVSVNPEDYQHLKDLSRAGLSIGMQFIQMNMKVGGVENVQKN